MLIDSHCHLHLPDLAGKHAEIFAEMAKNGVGGAICVGVTIEDFPSILALIERHPNLLATVGVHPENTDVQEASLPALCELAQHPDVVAIGETGLDYYWHKDRPEWQRERFRTHIRAARELGKPLVIHNREATEDILHLLVEERADEAGGVMHCFTESWEMAQKFLDLGFYLSLSGIVTFKNAAQVKEVARKAPLDRLLVETDSPYLAPVPYRGKINQPGYDRYVAEEIARLRDIAIDEVARTTTHNCFRLFPAARKKITL